MKKKIFFIGDLNIKINKKTRFIGANKKIRIILYSTFNLFKSINKVKECRSLISFFIISHYNAIFGIIITRSIELEF